MILTENVETLSYTRDWIGWECGVAVNKEIWVFEHNKSSGRISVAVPRLNHYVCFGQDGEWRAYLHTIINSDDDSNVLPTLAATTTGGAMLNEEDRGEGAVAGFLVGMVKLALDQCSKPSLGISIRCGHCLANYRVHLPARKVGFRCPVCHTKLVFAPVNNQTVAPLPNGLLQFRP